MAKEDYCTLMTETSESVEEWYGGKFFFLSKMS